MKLDPAKSLPAAAAILIVLGSGYVHGRWTGRWSKSHELQDAVVGLARLPQQIGDWHGKDLAFNPKDLMRAGVDAGLMRTYQNHQSGATVSVLLVCGRPGPISVHTPDICYQGAGYVLMSEPAREEVQMGTPPRTAEFLVGDFHKDEAVVSENLRIHWAWNGGNGWKAPDNPRLAFASRPVLYKLYVIRSGTTTTASTGDDPTVEFFRRFLPELEATALAARPASAS